MAGRDVVELGEHGLLDLHPLRHRLDHEVDVAEALVLGGARDAADDLLELGVGLLLRDLLLLHQPAELGLGDLAGLLEARVHELLLDVLEHDRKARAGDDLRDLPPIVPAPTTAALNTYMLVRPSGSGALRPDPGVMRADPSAWPGAAEG